MNYKLYIIFYYIYVLILVEKPKEQPKGRMEEPGKDGGKEDSESPAATTTTSSSAAPTRTATSTPASGSPPPRCLSVPPVCMASIGNGWCTRWQRRQPVKRRSGKESAWRNGRLMVARRCRKRQRLMMVPVPTG